MNPNSAAFVNLLNNPFKARLFLFSRLPSAFFSGVRVREIDSSQSRVSVPYRWFSRNPFGSTYFACLAMAAEMSTGILGLMQVYKRNPSVSMLVVGLSGNFFKKAVGLTLFTCGDGKIIEEAVERALSTGEGQAVVARSRGTNEVGELIAEFQITWSFKMKKRSI
jgi:acyl-coenzyme A thioesterase PaaI-like protein